METKALLSKTIEGERAPFLALYRYASKSDKAMLAVSMVFAAIAGVCLPIFAQIQGELLDSMSDTNDETISDAWIRNKIARGYSRSEIKDSIEDKLNSDNSFYDEVMDNVKIMLVLGFIGLMAAWIGLMIFIRVGLSQANSYRRAYLESLLKKPISYFERNTPANVCASLDNECTRIEAATGEKLFILIYTIFFITLGFFLAFRAHFQLTLIALLQLPITGLGSVLLSKTMANGADVRQRTMKESGGLAEECLLELRSVQSMNCQIALTQKYEKILQEPKGKLMVCGFLAGLGLGLVLGGTNLINSIALYAGSIMLDDKVENWVTGEELEAMHIVIIACVMSYTCSSVGNIGPCIQAIVEGKVAAHTMIASIDGEKEPDGDQSPEFRGAIEIKDLRFSYPLKLDVEILKGVNISIKSGETIALVGESGSGKSTVMCLLLRYYEPDSGVISFDGTDSSKLSLSKMRSQMSLVSQEPLLFNLSIKENIRLGSLTATDEEIVSAAEKAGVLKYVGRLPQGLDTNVGTKGGFLSGGQKQRIAIARAILKNPKILLLDEATSSLDNKTEALIIETLKEIGVGRTTIIIAQRLKTVVHANSIYVFKQGKVIEQGSHEALMAQKGNYYGLYSRQNPFYGEEEIDIEAEKAAEAIIPAQEAQLAGQAVPAMTFKKTKAMKRIFSLLKGRWILLSLGCFLSICAGVTFPVFGYYLGESIYYICREDGDDMLNDVYEAVLARIVISLVIILVFTLNNLILSRLATNFTARVRRMAFKAMLHYDQTYMDEKSDRPSELTNILTVEAEKLHSIGPLFGVALMVFASLFVGIVLGIWHDWQLGIVFGAAIPILAIGLARGFVQKVSLTSVDYQSNRSLAADVILNAKQVYTYNLQEYFLQLYMANSSVLADKAKTQSIESSMHYGLQILAFFYSFALAFWYGAWLIKEENLSYEKLTVIIFVEFFSCLGIIVASAIAPELSSGVNATHLIASKIDQMPVIDSYGETGRAITGMKGKLTFDNLSFSYANREAPVLRNLNFTIEPGKNIGICGSTGSGKSTTVSMILRFYDPQAGAVLIDDVNVKELHVRSLRSHIGWVPQEPVLFRGTLRENLKLAKPEAQDDELIEALKAAEAYTFIPDKGGLDAEVSFRSANFSGGEKQRLALARGFLRKPAIMILDEGTSALDSESEHKVLLEIKKLDCTVVNIAHRLTTIEHCDTILVLELGQVVEQGSHAELMQLNNLYANLVREGKKS
jgi:ATP-binding cassette subfamily B (MDR/TAP) protein 1